jgi:hypothetical protein
MSLLKGTYTSPNRTVLDYEVVSVNDRFFFGFNNGASGTIKQIFPTGGGIVFSINKDDFENFMENVVNKPDAVWQVTTKTSSDKVNVPGSWTTDDSASSGGHKRSGHKRSGHKRSGHKRSGHKRSGHKRSGHHKRSKIHKSHKRSGKSRRH